MAKRLTEQEARELTDRIKSTISDLTKLIIAAYEGEADQVLPTADKPYGRWDVYVRHEFPELPRFDRPERQQAAREMLEAGMSRREIAPALGVDERTIRRDLEDDLSAANAAERSSSRPPAPRTTSIEARERVRAALPKNGTSVTIQDLVTATDLPRETIRDQLRNLRLNGEARQTIDACPAIVAEVLPVPFSWYRDKLAEYIEELHVQHDLTPKQAKALAEVADAMDRFVATATA